MARFVVIPVMALGLVILAGCGSRPPAGTGIKVKGTLVQNGKPLQPAPKEDDTVEIIFRPFDAKASNAEETGAHYNHAEGTFEFKGRDKAGVVPGDYRVVLNYVAYQGEGNDLFREQFSRESSPLKYTVSSDKEQEIVIDVAKKTVTKVK